MRTPKYLYAVIKGLPVVKPEWVHACVAARRQLPMRDQQLLCSPAAEPPPPVFAGLRIHLHGGRTFVQPFGLLLQHAGAELAPALEAPAILGPACDIALIGGPPGGGGDLVGFSVCASTGLC